MTRDYSLFIKGILEAINDIENFIGNMNFEAFSSDKKRELLLFMKLKL